MVTKASTVPSSVVSFVWIALPITLKAFIDSSELAALATPLPALTSLSPLFILPTVLTGTLPAIATGAPPTWPIH